MKEDKLPAKTLPRVEGSHEQDWVRACKTGKPAGADFAYSGPLTEICLLGNIAKRVDARIEWDAANLKVTNLPEANRVRPDRVPQGLDVVTRLIDVQRTPDRARLRVAASRPKALGMVVSLGCRYYRFLRRKEQDMHSLTLTKGVSYVSIALCVWTTRGAKTIQTAICLLCADNRCDRCGCTR